MFLLTSPSRSPPTVEVEHAAESLPASHFTHVPASVLIGDDQLAAKALMMAFTMVVADERRYGAAEMVFAERNDPAQALGLAGKKESLGVCV